jgi:hypothetical protein
MYLAILVAEKEWPEIAKRASSAIASAAFFLGGFTAAVKKTQK